MFDSFFLAGFEGATGYNAHGEWIDQVAATHHDRFAAEDYALVRAAGIRAARECVRWPLVDRRGRYDFSSLDPFLAASRASGVEVVWDLFHFGYPEGADPFAAGFADRFAEYCRAAAAYISARTDGPLHVTPVNEPSFLAWAAGDAGLFAPHATGRSFELKVSLARAAIRGVDAVRSVRPDARVLTVDPLCRVVAPVGAPHLEPEVRHFNSGVVYEALDMIAGRLLPELGGSPAHLGTVGINYYWTNQWEIGRPEAPLDAADPRRAPLRDIVRDAWLRYGAEVLVSETSHVGDARAHWLGEVAEESIALLDEGVPLGGVCLYPILGMPEWHARSEWARMGLWDVEADGAGVLRRSECAPMMEALRACAGRIESHRRGTRVRAKAS